MDVLASTFVLFLVVLDPVGVAATFAVLTRGTAAAHRTRMALKGTLLAGLILFTLFFVGDALLRAMGIGIPAFRIAGGILLFLLSIDMVFARQSGLRSTTEREQLEAEHKADVSVFPVAFPLIAGPGAMTTVLLMASAGHAPMVVAGLLGVLAGTLLLTLLALLLAPVLLRVLGETGANVVSRLLGVILAALAAQYVLDGLLVGLGLGAAD